MTVRSKYGFGGYLQMFVVLVCAFITLCTALLGSKGLAGELKVRGAGFAFLLLAFLFSWFLYRLAKQLLTIGVEGDRIRFSLPFLPFVRWSRRVDSYDCKCAVRVYGNHVLHPATWLVANGHPCVEIYRYVYRNYDELAAAIPLPRKRVTKPVDAIDYVALMLRLRQVKCRDVRQWFCPVCGLPLGDFAPWGTDGKTPTYEICPCCGVEWGYEDDSREARRAFRHRWLASGAEWFHPQERPRDWNLDRQLKNVKKDECD